MTKKTFSHIKLSIPFLTLRRSVVIIVFIVFIVWFYFFVLQDIPSTRTISQTDYPQSTRILDRNGKLLYTIYANKDQAYVPLAKIPKDLQDATIAIEDKSFYQHGAVDFRGILRAAYSTIIRQKIQGGSTLTQQLVKNTLLTPRQTISRKVKEIILSYIVEAIYSKNKILEMYLNQVPYGGAAYGVQAASELYFDKPVSKLNLAESAFIAGLPQEPSLYSPFGSEPELGKQRQEAVLKQMELQGYITKKQEQAADHYQLQFAKFPNQIFAPHFVFYVKNLLTQKYGQRMVEQGGLTVTTSLDYNIQQFAQNTIATEVAKLKNDNVTNGAALVTDPGTGEILAMVGSKNYFDTANGGNVNVTLALRQPGSSIKPINYVTGLMNGYTAATPFVDVKTCFSATYCPHNYDYKYHGVVQMRYALANSINIPAVEMLKINGLDAMVKTAKAMGITSFTDPARYGLTLTLGGAEVRMIDMVEAYGVFANLGYKVDLHPILKVTDRHGNILQQYTPPASPIFGKKVIPAGDAYVISDILADNNARAPEFGSNSPLYIPGYYVSVKTGTTNDYRDNWTIGYTPKYVVAVWVGNNNDTPMQGVISGITGAAPIWHKIMSDLIVGKPKDALKRPQDIVDAIICSTSGLLPEPPGSPYICPTRQEIFVKGTVPTKVDPGKLPFYIDKTTDAVVAAKTGNNIEQGNEAVVMDPLGNTFCVTCAPPTGMPYASLWPQPTPTPAH